MVQLTSDVSLPGFIITFVEIRVTDSVNEKYLHCGVESSNRRPLRIEIIAEE